MLRLRELPVGSQLVGLYWPTSARFMRLSCPANAVIMSSPALFPPASRLYFHLLIFVLTSDRFVPRTKPISVAPRYGNSRRSLNSRTDATIRSLLIHVLDEPHFYSTRNTLEVRIAIFIRSNSSRPLLLSPPPPLILYRC